MKLSRSLLSLIALVAVSACATVLESASFAGGAGSSPDQAIVMVGARTEFQFRAAQEAWIRQWLPGARCDGGSYVVGPCACHVVTVTLADGTTRSVYFDMSTLGQ